MAFRKDTGEGKAWLRLCAAYSFVALKIYDLFLQGRDGEKCEEFGERRVKYSRKSFVRVVCGLL